MEGGEVRSDTLGHRESHVLVSREEAGRCRFRELENSHVDFVLPTGGPFPHERNTFYFDMPAIIFLSCYLK